MTTDESERLSVEPDCVVYDRQEISVQFWRPLIDWDWGIKAEDVRKRIEELRQAAEGIEGLERPADLT